ncbi:LapD/MoxY N-terminal periplasmic domain-containing protein [Comamonas endophytica]
MKQLLISVTVAILAILTGTLAFSIGAAREYLDGQLQSESDNAAASLALSLSQPANQDPVTRELLMTALFDGGQFKLIRLVSTRGETLFERMRPDRAPTSGHVRLHAPRWFEELLPLREPRVQRAISDGWTQVGQLTLEVEDGYAREALWRSSVRMATLVLAAGAAWALFVVLLLRWFRRLLQREIEAQVLAIDSGRAAPLTPRPTTGPWWRS